MKRSVIKMAALWGACLTAVTASGANKVDKAVIPGNHAVVADLGRSYVNKALRLLNVSCVQGEVISLGNSDGEIRYEKDMSGNELFNSLSGGIDGSVNVAPQIKVSAEAKFARKFAHNRLAETHTVLMRVSPQSLVFKPGSLELAPIGTQVSEKYPGDTYRFCGDEFISQIDLGAVIVATMKLDFLNHADKRQVAGKISVDVAGGLVSVAGDLDYVDSKVKRRTKVTMAVKQLGGDPSRLGRAVPASLVECSLDNMKTCMDTFGAVLSYIDKDFSSQLVDPNNYNVLRYHTESYADSAVFDLTPASGVGRLAPLVKLKRDELNYALDQQLENVQRAQTVLRYFSSYLSEEKYLEVEQIKTASERNSLTLADAIGVCLDDTVESCLDIADSLVLIDYDDAILDEQLGEDNSFFAQALCERHRQLAFEAGRIDDWDLQTYRRRNWAPEYQEAGNRNSKIQGWFACDDVLPGL